MIDNLCSLWLILFFFIGNGICLENTIEGKVCPILREILFRREVTPDSSYSEILKKVNSETAVEVFIQTDDPEVLRRRGIYVRSIVGDIVTAALPLSMVEPLAKLSSIFYIEAASLCKPVLDVSIPEIGVDQVRSGYLGTEYHGRKVIIGIYDSGIDWAHPDFITPNGESRILFIWDQTDDEGLPPQGFNYGTEYTQTEISDEIDGTPTGEVRERDINGHGTHVTGIAAGNGNATGNGKPSGIYVGVAPEADLIIVKGGDEMFLDTEITDGLNYIFQKADEIGRPTVVNLSLGNQKGPHDGTSSLERVIDSFLIEKGRAVVVAAGNCGDKTIHARGKIKSFSLEDTVFVEFKVEDNPEDEEDRILFDIWYPLSSDLSITVVTPKGERVGPVSSGMQNQWPNPQKPMIIVDNAVGGMNPFNQDKEICTLILDVQNNGFIENFGAGTWKFLFTGRPGEFDVWLYDSSVNAEIISEVDPSTLLNTPGNSYLCMTVGSYISRIYWPSLLSKPQDQNNLLVGNLSEVSSPGPTRDGRRKPEITAPGEIILSSLSFDIEDFPSSDLIASDSMHWALRGTSMSAPHVTGLIALMFQANPDLTVSEIRDKIIQSARQDLYTGTVWNQYWGWGKLDALKTMQMTSVQNEQKEEMPESYLLIQNYPNPFNGTTVIEYVVPDWSGVLQQMVYLGIYDLGGRMVYSLVQESQGPGRYKVCWEGQDEKGNRIASGIYVYRLTVDDLDTSQKMLYLR